MGFVRQEHNLTPLLLQTLLLKARQRLVLSCHGGIFLCVDHATVSQVLCIMYQRVWSALATDRNDQISPPKRLSRKVLAFASCLYSTRRLLLLCNADRQTQTDVHACIVPLACAAREMPRITYLVDCISTAFYQLSAITLKALTKHVELFVLIELLEGISWPDCRAGLPGRKSRSLSFFCHYARSYEPGPGYGFWQQAQISCPGNEFPDGSYRMSSCPLIIKWQVREKPERS